MLEISPVGIICCLFVNSLYDNNAESCVIGRQLSLVFSRRLARRKRQGEMWIQSWGKANCTFIEVLELQWLKLSSYFNFASVALK